jgi:sporulation protein YlmC with PRC-barrel domain
MNKYFAAALLTTALIAGAASAQTSTANKIAAANNTAAMHREGDWRASKLVGLNVYNDANDKIGDISDIILDKSGKVENVVLGVGGFLGMGEHYVAVAYDKLRWSNEAPRSTTSSNTSTSTSTRPATNVDNNTRNASDGTVRTTGTATTNTENRKAEGYWYPDHAIYNATKDQLMAMPQFKY